MDHTRWARQRKSLAPAFGPGLVNAQFLSLRKYLMVCGLWLFLSIKTHNSPIIAIRVAATNNNIIDFSALNVLLTLDFVGKVAFGIDLQALEQGENCRVLQIFDIVLPELMKCGLFFLERKYPFLRAPGICTVLSVSYERWQNMQYRSAGNITVHYYRSPSRASASSKY